MGAREAGQVSGDSIRCCSGVWFGFVCFSFKAGSPVSRRSSGARLRGRRRAGKHRHDGGTTPRGACGLCASSPLQRPSAIKVQGQQVSQGEVKGGWCRLRASGRGRRAGRAAGGAREMGRRTWEPSPSGLRNRRWDWLSSRVSRRRWGNPLRRPRGVSHGGEYHSTQNEGEWKEKR